MGILLRDNGYGSMDWYGDEDGSGYGDGDEDGSGYGDGYGYGDGCGDRDGEAQGTVGDNPVHLVESFAVARVGCECHTLEWGENWKETAEKHNVDMEEAREAAERILGLPRP